MDETQVFIEMIERYDRGLRALAYRLLRDGAAMDDVLQEAYLKAFRGSSGFRGEAQPGTWLYRIVYNACLDRLRSQQRTREMSLEALLEVLPGIAAGDATGAGTRRPGVAGAGFSYDEAAEVLGAPPGTIASRLNHARSALRKTLVEGRDSGTF